MSEENISEEMREKIIRTCEKNPDANWAAIAGALGVDQKVVCEVYMDWVKRARKNTEGKNRKEATHENRADCGDSGTDC